MAAMYFPRQNFPQSVTCIYWYIRIYCRARSLCRICWSWGIF